MAADANEPPATSSPERSRAPLYLVQRAAVLLVAAVAVAAAVIGGWLYSQHASVPFTRLAEVELGGRGGVGHTLRVMHPEGTYSMGSFTDDLRQTLRWDWSLILGGGVTLLLGNALGYWLLRRTRTSRGWSSGCSRRAW